MKLISPAAAAVAAIVLTVPTSAVPSPSSSKPEYGKRVFLIETTTTHSRKAQHPVLVKSVHSARRAVWACQQKAGLPATRAELDTRQLSAVGFPFRGWIINRWEARLSACRNVLNRTLLVTGDWMTAVQRVQRAFPGSAWWLDACSTSEGGHGPWKWRGGTPVQLVGRFPDVRPLNYPGNVPGGPMQYFRSTFDGDFRRALADLRSRGIRLPEPAHSWFSPLGQAVAAGWAYEHARPSGKWTGSSC